MTNEQATYRRVLRRETHAPRTIPAVAVAVVAAAFLLVLLAGGIRWFIDVSFREIAVGWLGGLSGLGWPQLVPFGIGAVIALLAITLLALAVLPGRRARRARTTDRTALLVDDGVIADSIAEAVAGRAGVDRGRVAVTVARRSVSVRITPISGVSVDRAAAEAAVTRTLSGIGFTALPRVIVEANGVIA